MVLAGAKIKLSEKEIQGFVNLLQDSDDKLLALMSEQISKFDDTSLHAIEEYTRQLEDEQLIDNWYHVSKLNLTREIKGWKRKQDLEEGLFLIARLKNPGLEVKKYKAILDNYAERVSVKLTTSSKSHEILEAINTVLFKEEAFVGNQIDYYDLNNNFLHSVLEARTGNPIMISVIYILIGRRLGLDIRGIGTPGHFIVQFEDTLYDPFFSGREVMKEECILRAQELSVNWRDEYLEPIDDAFIISRSIRNLVAIYKKLNDLDKAADVSNLLKLV